MPGSSRKARKVRSLSGAPARQPSGSVWELRRGKWSSSSFAELGTGASSLSRLRLGVILRRRLQSARAAHYSQLLCTMCMSVVY